MKRDTEAAILKYSVLFSSIYECCERLRSGNIYDVTIIDTCKKLLFAIKDVQVPSSTSLSPSPLSLPLLPPLPTQEQVKSMPSYPYPLEDRSHFCSRALREGQDKFSEVHSHLRSLVISAKELAKEGHGGGMGRVNFEVHLRGLIPSLWDLSRFSMADQVCVYIHIFLFLHFLMFFSLVACFFCF